MKDMTLEQAQKLKSEAENEILLIVRRLQEAVGKRVNEIKPGYRYTDFTPSHITIQMDL